MICSGTDLQKAVLLFHEILDLFEEALTAVVQRLDGLL